MRAKIGLTWFNPDGNVGDNVKCKTDQIVPNPHSRVAGFGKKDAFIEPSNSLTKHHNHTEHSSLLPWDRCSQFQGTALIYHSRTVVVHPKGRTDG